jgi:hypothetical protein
MFIVPPAFTSTSSYGIEAALSCDGCAAVIGPLGFEKIADFLPVTDVGEVMAIMSDKIHKIFHYGMRSALYTENSRRISLSNANYFPALPASSRTHSEPINPPDPVMSDFVVSWWFKYR